MIKCNWNKAPYMHNYCEDPCHGLMNNRYIVYTTGYCNINKPVRIRGFLRDTYYRDINTDDDWIKIADFPGVPRQNMKGVTIGDNFYCFGGWKFTPLTRKEIASLKKNNEHLPAKKNCETFKDSWKLHRSASGEWTWERYVDLPHCLTDFGITHTGSLIYIYGGGFIDSDLGQLSVKSGSHGDKLYVLDTDAPENGWTELRSCPGVKRILPAMTIIDSFIYVMGGGNCNEMWSYKDDPGDRIRTLNDNWRYDIKNDSWKRLRDFQYDLSVWGSGDNITFMSRYILLTGSVFYKTKLVGDRDNSRYECTSHDGLCDMDLVEQDEYRFRSAKLMFSYDIILNTFTKMDCELPLYVNQPCWGIIGDKIYMFGGEIYEDSYKWFDDTIFSGHLNTHAVGSLCTQKYTDNELFLDNAIIAETNNIHISPNDPSYEGVVLSNNKPYEGKYNNYYVIVYDDNMKRYVMYYSANRLDENYKEGYGYDYTCVAVSTDGINFIKPNICNVMYENSVENNIVMYDEALSHNLHPMILDDGSYVAIAGMEISHCKRKGIYLLKSGDGLKWNIGPKIIDKSASLNGFKITYFDSHNQILHNNDTKRYMLFVRHNPKRGVRSVQITTTTDFTVFDEFTEIVRCDSGDDSIYCLNAAKYPDDVVNYFIAFPCMMMGNDITTKSVSMFSSSDGYKWNRLITKPYKKEYFMNPYNAVVGLVKSPDKKKLYKYLLNLETSEVLCFSYPVDRIMRLTTNMMGTVGSITTKPLILSNDVIYINYSVDNPDGNVIIDVLSKDGTQIYKGDKLTSSEMDKCIRVGKLLIGVSVCIRFTLYNSSLYSFKYTSIKH